MDQDKITDMIEQQTGKYNRAKHAYNLTWDPAKLKEAEKTKELIDILGLASSAITEHNEKVRMKYNLFKLAERADDIMSKSNRIGYMPLIDSLKEIVEELLQIAEVEGYTRKDKKKGDA